MATSVDAKIQKSTKFPVEFNQKVDMQKVRTEVVKKWIASRISDILGNEDDVVIEMIYNLIEEKRFIESEKLAEQARKRRDDEQNREHRENEETAAVVAQGVEEIAGVGVEEDVEMIEIGNSIGGQEEILIVEVPVIQGHLAGATQGNGLTEHLHYEKQILYVADASSQKKICKPIKVTD
ncbi:putative PWI domain-containing protein [Glarea lozoyensis 74030]|uniref:Putative PWI domain-containing protein n=1 Tax=Glarea lozoyensis (strain ATCC 74030 / MF5533) TaxID=1104152 RepID=H0ETT6_GLAL7|nr:putative PWI domain-containing protein [Glarea lozoyensis 74030]